MLELNLNTMNATQLARLFWVIKGDERKEELVKSFGVANCGEEEFYQEIEFEKPERGLE